MKPWVLPPPYGEATNTLPPGTSAGWMLADVTGEMRRILEWQAVLVQSHKALGQPYLVDSPAQRIGYLGAAAIPLFVSMAVTGWKHGYAPSGVMLAMAGNDGGSRAAVCLQKV